MFLLKSFKLLYYTRPNTRLTKQVIVDHIDQERRRKKEKKKRSKSNPKTDATNFRCTRLLVISHHLVYRRMREKKIRTSLRLPGLQIQNPWEFSTVLRCFDCFLIVCCVSFRLYQARCAQLTVRSFSSTPLSSDRNRL